MIIYYFTLHCILLALVVVIVVERNGAIHPTFYPYLFESSIIYRVKSGEIEKSETGLTVYSHNLIHSIYYNTTQNTENNKRSTVLSHSFNI